MNDVGNLIAQQEYEMAIHLLETGDLSDTEQAIVSYNLSLLYSDPEFYASDIVQGYNFAVAALEEYNKLENKTASLLSYGPKVESLKNELDNLLFEKAIHDESIVFSKRILAECPHHPQIDSINTHLEWMMYTKARKTNTLQSYIEFTAMFPSSVYAKNAISDRRKLFFSYDKVIDAGLNTDTLIKQNPCYIPLYEKVDRIYKKRFVISDLYNDSLPESNPYRTRYIVADLNTLDKNMKARGVREIYPVLEDIWEFEGISKIAKELDLTLDTIANSSMREIDRLFQGKYKAQDYRDEILRLKNYYTQVHKFRHYPFVKDSIVLLGGRRYVVGQQMCLCEIQEDTIEMVAKFVTTGKGVSKEALSFPIGRKFEYYAPLNYISERLWETRRVYTDYDRMRDSLMGGGTNKITLYEQKIQLPNFLSIKPMPQYPNASRGNGIHQSAVGTYMRTLLGVPASLGCLRLYRYQIQFARWWVPRCAKLVIYLEEDRYVRCRDWELTWWGPKEETEPAAASGAVESSGVATQQEPLESAGTNSESNTDPTEGGEQPPAENNSQETPPVQSPPVSADPGQPESPAPAEADNDNIHTE